VSTQLQLTKMSKTTRKFTLKQFFHKICNLFPGSIWGFFTRL